MRLDRNPGAAYLYLTGIGPGGIDVSFGVDEMYDAAMPAVVDLSADGRILGIEWLEPCLPEHVVPEVEFNSAEDHATVWLVEQERRLHKHVARVPDTYGLPGEVDLHFGPRHDLQAIEARPATRLLPLSLLEAAEASRAQ